MYICVYVCVYACIYIYICMYVYVYICADGATWLWWCMCICMYIYMCVCMYVYMHVYIYIYIHVCIIYIIIIMSRRLRGYPWPSLAISPYHSSPPAGLQDYNPCPHIAAVCKFVLVVPHLHIHEWGSTGVHRLWARPCFSSSVPRVWFVELV